MMKCITCNETYFEQVKLFRNDITNGLTRIKFSSRCPFCKTDYKKILKFNFEVLDDETSSS